MPGVYAEEAKGRGRAAGCPAPLHKSRRAGLPQRAQRALASVSDAKADQRIGMADTGMTEKKYRTPLDSFFPAIENRFSSWLRKPRP